MTTHQSKIEKLVAEKCPDGMEFLELGEVAKLQRGSSITKNSTTEGVYPVIAGGQRPAYYIDQYNREGETITVAGSGAYAGFVMYWDEPIFVSDAFSVKVKGGINAKYIYYFLLSLQDKIHDLKRGGGVPHVYAKDVSKFKIPVPPIEVQEEIAKILDSFTQLEAELEAELEARGKQYEHYRSELLSSNDGVRKVAISEICKISRGRVISKDYLTANEGEYPVYSSQTTDEGAFGHINTYDYDGEYLTWTTDGANAGSIFYRNGKFSITNVCGLLKVQDKDVNPKFLAYKLSTVAKKHVSSGMGNPKLMSNVMANVEVAMPSLEEQNRIVSILDKFDALVNDISIGLPAEIVARRKQYEYYRNQLLTFKELEK